ncbi:predicted protein [Sclerotinia sclerotiorum 1980 UF-70]|uniref:Uncharacterized protein n=1 Tax=Sclerotinia sclerotiorum (strain ATCC 18683 / 1980 / Ss-1) TaxID=665079 RepID=A7ERH9_SCLS1|nr:predicted protein [Sclerotinia sclerotiorum 1980 UF-70]EDN92071.1 predicted protein [Sclerotinia sclerotiorum 1980 UF-70]
MAFSSQQKCSLYAETYTKLEEWDSNVRYSLEQPGMRTGTSSTLSTSDQTTPTEATTNQATPIQAVPRVRPRLLRYPRRLSIYRQPSSYNGVIFSREPLQAINSISQENVQQTAEESLEQNNPHNTEFSLGSELLQVPEDIFDTVAENEGAPDTD